MDGRPQMESNQEKCNSSEFTRVNVAQSSVPTKHKIKKDGMPEIDMEFESEEHAYDFYNSYAGHVGFSVRKDWVNRSKTGVVRSRKFCCYKEGQRRYDKRDEFVNKHRKETRTGCLAQMNISLQPNGKYRISLFEARHNHEVVNPDSVHMLPSQKRVVSKADAGDSSGVKHKLALVGRKSRGQENLDNLLVNGRNYLLSKRSKTMKTGDAGGLLRYFHKQQWENPSFFYAIEVDIDDRLTNFFWADAKMVVDYNYFGDVVCFDTTYKTSKRSRPFSPFFGVNHHKQPVIFGVALLYDETSQSFKWLLETFIEAMSGKKPKTILTDEDPEMAKAIASVLPETYHRMCVWQMYQNALIRLSQVFGHSGSFGKDFRNCIYDYEEEEDFIQAWEVVINKYDLKQNEWLQQLFEEREKWALPYGRDKFCADMKSTQRSKSLSGCLRRYLNSDLDILQFLQHFEKTVAQLRYEELKASFDMTQRIPKLLVSVNMLKHAREVYTPAVFEMFQREYELCLDGVVNRCSEIGTLIEYKVGIYGKSQEHTVTFNLLDDTVDCSCQKLEFVGILCSHALKVLDHRNIKVVPTQYILKRWTKSAKDENVRNSSECTTELCPKLDVANRYKELYHAFVKIATKAAGVEEAYKFAAKHFDEVMLGVDEIIKITPPEEPLVTTSSSPTLNASESQLGESIGDERTVASLEDLVSLSDDIGIQNDNDEMEIGDESAREDDIYRVEVEDHTKSTKVKGLKRKKGVVCKEGGKETLTERSSRSRSLRPLLPRVQWPLPGYHPAHAPPPNLLSQGPYRFETNTMVQYMYQLPIPVRDQQSDSIMPQPSVGYSNQHGLHQESVCSSSQLSPVTGCEAQEVREDPNTLLQNKEQ